MKNYIAITINTFDDYGGKEIAPENERVRREVGDVFRCDRERFLYLKSRKLVNLAGIDKLQPNK